MPRLTAKQAAFVREYAKDWNASAAAERAGMTADYGRQLLTKSHVQAAIEELREEARTDAVMSLRELQQWWSEIVRGETPEGDLRDALRASELLGKSQGAFTDKVENTHRFDGIVGINVTLPDDA